MLLKLSVFLLVSTFSITLNCNAQDTLVESMASKEFDSTLKTINESHSEFQSDEEVYFNQKIRERNFWMTLFAVMAIGGVICMKIREKQRYNHRWQKDVFNKNRPLKQDHLLEAYMRLGVKMMIEDRVDIGEKLKYLNNYLRKYFPKSDYNFEEILKSAYRNPISLTIVSKWLNHHLKDPSQKSQLLYFLAGVSIIDGSIEPQEEKLLYDLGELLHLSRADILSVISMYQKQAKFDQKPSNSATEKARMHQMIVQASSVLNVSIYAGLEEIKKAYRRMVKLHHPDKFFDQSEDQQKIAHERFLHIQEAYEFLEKRKMNE